MSITCVLSPADLANIQVFFLYGNFEEQLNTKTLTRFSTLTDKLSHKDTSHFSLQPFTSH